MSQTKTISHSVTFIASQSDVFDAVTNWEFQSKWIPFTNVVGVGENSHQLGGKLEAFTGIGRVGFLDTMTITKWEPPFVCEVTHTGNFVKGSGLFEVSNDADGAKFTWTEYFSLPSGILGNLIWAIVWVPFKIGLIISLWKFSKNFKK
jgi:hypothetical protein